MYSFVFTHDAHVIEPDDLVSKHLPERYRSSALNVKRSDGYVAYCAGDNVIYHMKLDRKDGDISRSEVDVETKRAGKMPGGRDIGFRLKQMADAGVDSSIIFSGLLGFAGALEPGPCLAHMQIFNDWCIDHFKAMPHTFVPNAMLPAYSPEAAVQEFRRVLDLGYRSVMVSIEAPEGAPNYIDTAWDPLWALAKDSGTPLTMHSGTSTRPIRYRAAGAACMNYFTLGLIAQESIASLVVSGVFDRHPRLRLVNCESGADWLLWMGERLDEVYLGHHAYTYPKLKRLPSETLYEHVIATTHRERGCIRTRHLTGLDCVIWSDDYPHAEGCYPNTRSILNGLFDGIEISQREKDLIVGGTAARLYHLDPVKARAEKEQFLKLTA
ncbi:amidohydrolase family protein [Paraburkholderia dinghuensis]|uniref:Amidohydrolase n=1 Tax=Paraburkholderia dinghuensis TaxID=2305225 RepID=A0A3N6MST0_9BURK|nr:amidohydrolase family protein [Paraburkholderia dinghuensis]RQH04885.1 amidohydrolase [Paraburkholderia dinghuensis]